MSILKIDSLSVGFYEKGEMKTVIKEISFELSSGKILGIVGESGSGKSMTALTIMGLNSKAAKILGGSIKFSGQELLGLPEKEYCKIRGSEMSMVFQEPMTSLNPVLTIGKQAEEMLILHGGNKDKIFLDGKERKNHVLFVFEEVGLKEADKLYCQYPHELSGGMRQRVMIAIAMMCRPKVLIADEPTTALDIGLQNKLLMLLKKLNHDFGTSIILISHDLNVIRMICDEVLVMNDGRIAERGDVLKVLKSPQDEYTKKLLASSMWGENEKPSNSLFEPKKLFLKVEKLNVFYEGKGEGFFKSKIKKHAVKDVSFSLYKGEIFGLVGESGSGKSSVAMAIAGLQRFWNGKLVYDFSEDKILPQMVFQDPYGSLNPSRRIGWLLAEPLRLHSEKKQVNKFIFREKVIEMLHKVGLSEKYADRLPSELSGGQRQRVAIAMALMLNQKLILLDEPVSALDVTIQEQILRLLLSLQKDYGLTYLFVSHDMNVVRKLCHRVGVMYQGELVEIKETEELFTAPEHEYTKLLLGTLSSPFKSNPFI